MIWQLCISHLHKLVTSELRNISVHETQHNSHDTWIQKDSIYRILSLRQILLQVPLIYCSDIYCMTEWLKG